MIGKPGPLEEGVPPMMDDATEPAPPPAAPITVPLVALAMPDDKEEMQEPTVGDIVTFTVEGTVEGISGGMAMVRATTVNGEPIEAPMEAAPADEPELQQLRSMARERF